MPALRTRDTQPRSLEVTTDALQPPTLAIISPTPRAFTFPSTHNLADSPYSSPSNSPFEPDQLDLRSLPSQCILAPHLTTNPQFQRTLSPISPVQEASTSPSPAPRPQTHQRRRSSCSISTDEERRPRKGDSDYIKRPENAFILFRRKCCEERQAAANDEKLDGPTKKQRQADLSKTISQQWKSLSAEERKVWEDKAKERKKEHEAMYPNYVYRPQRSKDKAKGKKAGKAGSKDDIETDPENVSFVLPMPAQRHGRSASAPTPPPYQNILLPNVYSMTPSCPTSPSLLPMITRRASQNGQSEDCVNSFDFLPHDNFMPPPFGHTGHFEASLQSSEFLRNIFAMPPLTSGSQKNELPIHVPNPNELLVNHKPISPASSAGSSGPSSPASGPYTPLAAITSQSFTQQLAGVEVPIPGPRPGELELPTDMQLPQDLASYAWDATSIWPTGSEILLGDDFDLNAIPALELGNGKFNGQYMEPSTALQFGQEFASALEGREYSQDNMISFDEMMVGPRY